MRAGCEQELPRTDQLTLSYLLLPNVLIRDIYRKQKTNPHKVNIS